MRFNKDRYANSALTDLAALFDWQYLVEPQLTSTKAGCLIHFQKEQKKYAPIILNDALIESLGPLNSRIDPGKNTIKNIVTLPYYRKKIIEDERYQQLTTVIELELNSTVTLRQTPANIEASQLYRADYSDGLAHDDELEQDLINNNPPTGHNEDEGYLVRGRVNDIPGLHFFDASSQSPDYGDIGIINNPEYIIFEPLINTSLRAKELQINTLGNAIVCSYLDITCTDTSELFDQSKIIFGLELKASGDLYIVENGTSTILSGKTYSTEGIYHKKHL